MSALFRKLLGVFRKRDQSPSSVSSQEMLTPERISERLHFQRVEHHSPRGAAPIGTACVAAVAAEPSSLAPELEFAVADTQDRDAPRLTQELCPEADVDVANVVQISTLAPVVANEPEARPLDADDIPEADEEVDAPIVAFPAVEQRPAQRPSRAQPPAEILAEFHASARHYFVREEAGTAGATADVLKILKLNAGEENWADLDVSAPKPLAVLTPPVGLEADISAPITPVEPERSPAPGEPMAMVGDEKAAGEATAMPLWRERTVGDVILEGDCSVRLANCIAANQRLFSDWTIGEALDRRSEFTALLKHVRSLGRKTANEALDALDAFALDPRSKLEQPVEGDEPVVADPLFGLVPAKLNAPLSEVLRGKDVTVRLANVAASGQLDGLTVRDFVLDPDAVRGRLRGCKNAGRKTTDEAIDFLAAYVEHLAQPLPEYEAPTRTDDFASGRISTGEWIRQVVASLLPKQVDVLYSRYGLDGETPQTLQEIAKRVHVSRERVRQVEAKTLKVLRDDARSRAAFNRYLAEEKEDQWFFLFGPQSLLPEDKISERLRQLDPWFVLAIDVSFEDGVDGYLEETAHKTDESWFRSSEEAEKRQKIDDLLSNLLQTYQTPMPLETLEEIAPSCTAFLRSEADHWVVHEGYIFTGHVGSKARRTAHMHAIARRIAKCGIFDIGMLIAEYRSQFPDDVCGSRMFEMQAHEAPHLFASLFDGIWLCLDPTSRHADSLLEPPFYRRPVEETHFAEGSLGDLLIRRLAQFGPQRMIDLRRDIADDGQNSFSVSSVGVVLISNPCFRRIAPGIFGLYTEGSETSASLDAHLLDDRHCRLYCYARHSGAASGYYPAWGPAYEMRLSSWARRHAPADLYRSLMAVIDPEAWPASPETIAEFLNLRQQEGQWLLGAARRHALGHYFPDSAQFFAVLTHLVVFGWISWFAVNRVTGTVSSNHHAINVLAFLIMTGLVEPESDWQAPLYPTDLAKRLFLEARWNRHVYGVEGSSGDDVFSQLRSALYKAPPTASRGWVDVEEFAAAMLAWCSEGISTGKAFGGVQSRQSSINAEDSFESNDWDAIFGG